jgi:hypothetical protein
MDQVLGGSRSTRFYPVGRACGAYVIARRSLVSPLERCVTGRPQNYQCDATAGNHGTSALASESSGTQFQEADHLGVMHDETGVGPGIGPKTRLGS